MLRLLTQDRLAGALLISSVGAGFIAAVMLIVQAWLLSLVVDRVFLKHQELSEVLPFLGATLAILLIRAGMIWLREVLAQRSASRTKRNLRRQLSSHLFALGPAYTHVERSGELVHTVVEGVETLNDYITQYIPALFLAVLVPISIFLVVLALDPWSTLVLVVAGPFLLLLLALIGGQTKAITERRFLELSWMSAFFLDILQGIATLKMFGRSREQAANIKEISQHYGNTTMEVLRTAFQTSLVMEWAATAATALVALEVSLRLMNQSLAFDRGLTVLLLTPEFFLPLRQMALKYHSGTTGKAAANRIYTILDTPSKNQTPANGVAPQSRQAIAQLHEIRFDRVSFAYEPVCWGAWHPPSQYPPTQPGERQALQDFSLTLQPGQMVALVGSTGAGKTTVANLLLRFINPDSGTILINGLPLQEIERAAWLSQVAWVPQHPYLFHGNVVENIRIARPTAGFDDIVAAAQAANAVEFIERLSQSYETPLDEKGSRLSGGQRQRIAIARAFLKNAPLLILDEATANLDSENEKLIQEALSRLVHGRMVLLIAHRLKLAYLADQIVVMDHGLAVETGDHQTLLRQGGLYQQLVTTYERGAR
jgi:thiol reductant ABC exporter CydD subunit